MAYRYGPPWRDIKAEVRFEKQWRNTVYRFLTLVCSAALLIQPGPTAGDAAAYSGLGPGFLSYTARAHLPGMLQPTVGWVLAHKLARKKTPHSQAPGQSMKADEPQQRLPPPRRVRVTTGASQQQWTFSLMSGPQLDHFRDAHVCGIQCGQRPHNRKENYGKEGKRLSITIWGGE